MFNHLHVHSEYSLLDGMSRIPRLIERAQEMGMEALALTDRGVMHGVIKFYLAAKKAGIKPIIGCEVYVAPNSRTERAGEKTSYHLVLLARNQEGYLNLIQLVTKAHLEGFYYKPRVDKELLEAHSEGLIALSACIGGEVPSLILKDRPEDAKKAALWYKKTFRDFYIEIQRQPMPELEKVNKTLIPLAKELEIPMVATNDTHYVNKEDAPFHDLLLCIGTNATIHDEKRMKMAGDFFYLKTPQEMTELYKDIPEALENTKRVADMCNLELEFGRIHLPQIDIPEGQTPYEFLASLCQKGLEEFYPDASQEILERLEYEMDVILQTDFANYFLVVWDIISFVKREGILYGVRGSAASSIVLHCLGITDIDPIRYKLVFERFLNVERKEMPDIDMDFEDARRDEVIRYVSQRYGEDHVAQIITFGTLGARAAIRDVGRALAMPYGDVDRIARMVPAIPGITLEKALEENAELKTAYEQEAVVKNLVDSAKGVGGIARHASTHAAGVVISQEPLTLYMPLQRSNRAANGNGALMTQLDMEDIAKIGLLKMDFLGLANLTILGRARELIKTSRNVDIDLHTIPMDDDKTFALLAAGETTGVFQLEGAGMRRNIKELKPTTFSDIAAMVALYRPGPMEQIPNFIESKYGRAPIKYPHQALEDILKETYGVIVYQEQVLFIVQAFAGYSLGQADIFRKAMGKKIADVMKKEKKGFVAGAKEKGFSAKLAGEVFALIEPFAGYAFNKAHAVSYALIAYQTAYLKANYPVEYMTAFLDIQYDQTEKVATAVSECRRLGIDVLPPNINHSGSNFTIDKDEDGKPAIRFGMTAIKNVGPGAVEALIEERQKNGAYASVEDFCQRADLSSVNKRVLESLIKAGALEELGERGTLLANAGLILSVAGRQQQLRQTGQSTMFDLWGEQSAVPVPGLEMEQAEAAMKDKLLWEKELMGIYLSEHPFSAYAGGAGNTTLCGQIEASLEGKTVAVAGVITSLRHAFTRDGNTFVNAELEDLDGSVEVLAWPRLYTATKDLWEEGNVLLIDGKVKARGDRVQIYADHVCTYVPGETVVKTPLPNAAKPAASPAAWRKKPSPVTPVKRDKIEEENLEACRLVVSLKQTSDKDEDIKQLNQIYEVLDEFPGKDAVNLRILKSNSYVLLKLPHVFINYCPELHQRLADVVGQESVAVANGG